MAYDFGRALEEMGVTGFYLEGDPQTVEELKACFWKLMGYDDNGEAIWSSDPDDFGFDFDQVVGAKAALNTTFGQEDLRYERDRRLKDTDHWAYQDTADMTQAQVDYRQALRDITKTYSTMQDVVWPTKP